MSSVLQYLPEQVPYGEAQGKLMIMDKKNMTIPSFFVTHTDAAQFIHICAHTTFDSEVLLTCEYTCFSIYVQHSPEAIDGIIYSTQANEGRHFFFHQIHEFIKP